MPKSKRDPLRHRIHAARWIERNPVKRRAHLDVRNAIRRGEMERKPCHCGLPAEAHHEDYAAPLDVEWLCRKHHAERHCHASAARHFRSIDTTFSGTLIIT